MEPNLVGREVYCKRNGTVSVILAQDDVCLTISLIQADVEDTKVITWGTFNRWYTVVPLEGDVKPNKSVQHFPIGEPGSGVALRDKFVAMVKEAANQELDLTVDIANKRDVIKYNGRNVFECSYASKRFNVMCHPESLTADNMRRVFKLYPKEWGWPLRAKFVFTSFSQVPLMKTIIVDGLFHRQIKPED